MPDRGCASLGGHMGGKDDVERWTSLYKGFTRPGRGKKLPEPDDATLRRLREVESRAAPVSIAPPAPTANRREQRPSAGHVTPAADPPPPPPPPQPSSANANDDAPAPASDVQPRRRRRNKAELAEAQAAAKREAVRVAVRHAMGGALAEDPHLRRLEAAAKLEAEVERARAMAMGAGEGSNDGASAHPRNGSSNPRVVAHQPPARRTKPADETSTRARLTPASPPPPSLTWEQHDAFLTYPPTRARRAHELPRGLKTSDLDALYRAVEREQRRFLAHVAQAARGVCASMGPRGMVRAARQWASRDVARRVDPKTGDAPGYVTPAPSPVAGPGLPHAFSLVTGSGKWESDDEPNPTPAVLSLESVRRTGGSRDKPPSRPSSRLGGSVDTPPGPSRRGSASNLSAFSGDSGGGRPDPTEAPIPPALLAACGRGVRLGEFVSALNPPLATSLASDSQFVPGEDDETNAMCESSGASAALTEGALACLVANAPGRLDRAWDLPVAICAWDGNDDSKDANGDVNGDVNGDEPNRLSRRRPRAVVHIGDPLPTRDCSPATWRARAAATYERAIARKVEDARRVRELERLSQRGPLGSLSGDAPPPVHFSSSHDDCVPVVRTHAVFSLGERKIVVRSTDMEVEAGAEGAGGKETAETVRCKVEFTEDPDASAGDLSVDCVEEEASWAEAARWWCALAARGGDPGIRTSEGGGSANGVGDLTVVLCRVRARDGSVARPPERFDADEILRRFCRDPPPPPSEIDGGSTRGASRGTSRTSDDDSGTESDESRSDSSGAATDPPHWFRGHGFDPAAGIQNVASAIDALATLPFGRYLLRHDVGSDVAEVFKEVAGPDGVAPTRGATMRRSTTDASRSDSPDGSGGVGRRRKNTGAGKGPPRRGKPPATAIHIPSGGRRTFGGRRMKNGGKRGHLFGGFSGVEEEEERPPPKSAKRLIVLPEIPMGVASALFIGGALEDPMTLRRGAGSRALAGAKNSKDFEPMPGPRDVGAECAVGVGYDWAAGHEKCADAERDSDEEDADGKPQERGGLESADRLLGFEFLPPVCRTEGQIDRTPAPRGDPGAGRAKARRDQKRGNWRAVLAPPAKESSGGSSDDSDSDDDVPIAGLLARTRTNGARSESDDDVPIAGLLARYGAGGSKKKTGTIARSRREGGAKGGGGRAAARKKTAGKERDAPPSGASPAGAESSSDDDVELEVDDDGHYVGVRYCRPFAHAGRCVRKGKCPDPHLTLREVRRMAAKGESNEHAMREVRQRVYATFAAVNAGRHHHTQQRRVPAWGNMPSLGGTRKATWARAGDSDDDD